MNLVPSERSNLPVKCWRTLYTKLTSAKVRYQDDDIREELSSCEAYFQGGAFQPSTPVPAGHIELREHRSSTFMESFYQRLSKILNVDQETSKKIFADYILHSCNNEGTLLQERLEKNVRAILLSTWSFYAQERIFFLKCYLHMISSSQNPESPYYEVFRSFLSKIPVRNRYSSVLKRYNELIRQELPSTSAYGVLADLLVPLWINYNLREQLELLLILILLTSQIKVNLEDIDHLVDLLQITSFGRYQCFFYHHSHLSDNQVLLQKLVQNAINLYAIQILSTGWTTDIYADNVAKFNAHNKILYPKLYDVQQGPVVIAWILILHHKLMNSNAYDEQLSGESFILLDDDLWKGVDDAVHSNIMEIPVIVNVMEPIIDDMVYGMFTNFGIVAFHSRRTLSSIITFFCKFQTVPLNQATTAILHYFRDRFPLDSCCLFKILSAVFKYATDIKPRKDVFYLLEHLEYTINRDECRLRSLELNKYLLEHELRPLKSFPNVVILPGTPAIPDFEENTVTLQKSLHIWDVIRNYLTMYLNGSGDETLTDTVTEIIYFIEISLAKLTTIPEDVMKSSELVVQVMWKSSTSHNSPENLKLLAACIQLQSVLFCYMPEDIIKCFEVFNFLPGYPVRMKLQDVQVHEGYYMQSRIYKIVCNEEAKTGKYSVLFAYLRFLLNLVQNILESWYVVAGLKFILHVYNSVNNDFWKFENLGDRNLIVWNCLEIINQILNQGLTSLYEKKEADALQNFEEVEDGYVVPSTYFIARSCVTAILSNVNESIILSTATAGDAALLESIMECASWNRGKSANIINITVYSLSIVQRCLIFIDVEHDLKHTTNELSLDHLFQPERCLALLSYRYNCFSNTISLLAIKLLIQLANIKENCMFSWLQYSHELLKKEFMYPLYCTNESTAVKSSLLALMAVCIAKQIVIADALLEVDKIREICVERTPVEPTWQNLLVFCSEYINKISEAPENYLSKMHCAVLDVIHVCWERKLKVPQQYFKLSKGFWMNLLMPFHAKFERSFIAYSFILDIICMEIMDAKTLDPALESEMDVFLNSERLTIWTETCSDLIVEEPSLTVKFEPISNPVRAVAVSWKKFLKVVANYCCRLIQNPGEAAFSVLKNLTTVLIKSGLMKKKKFLCDIYHIYLVTWESNCSKTMWEDELRQTILMFTLLDKSHHEYSSPYFFCALLEIGYKVLEFGQARSHITNSVKDAEDKRDLFLTCCGILKQELEVFSNFLSNKDDVFPEYAPLLLHLCICYKTIEYAKVSTELLSTALRDVDFISLLLRINGYILTAGCATKTTKMLLQFQNYIFEKYPLAEVKNSHNDVMLAMFQAVFPTEIPQKVGNNLIELFKNADRNDLYTYGIRFMLNLTKDQSRDSKTLLLDFNSKNKFFLYTILSMIEGTLRREDLRLVTAVATFYWRLTQNLFLCRYSEIKDLIEPMFLLFNCVKRAMFMVVQPSRMCSLLFNVPSLQLQEFFDSCDSSRVRTDIRNTYADLMRLIQIGMRTLSTFCFDAETILYGHWPPEDWNFRWLNKTFDEKMCVFPLLFFHQNNLQEDFTTFSTYITLEHRAVTGRMTTNLMAFENLVGNKFTIMDYDQTGRTLSVVSRFLLAQSVMYLVHPEIDQPRKLLFVNQIFVNLKEFIRNAINDAVNEVVEIPLFVESDESCEDASESSPVKLTPAPDFTLGGNASDSTFAEVTDGSTSNNSQARRLHTVEFNITARLFFKLITTFKNS